MRTYGVLVCAAVVLGGCKDRKAAAPPAEPAAGVVPAGMAPPRADPAALHLELGAVHERHLDAKGAAEQYAKAAASAAGGVRRAQAYAALARVKEAAGDRDAAIEALERARRELARDAQPAPSDGPPGPMGLPESDVLPALARLYLAKGLLPQAEKLVAEGLASARGTFARQELLRLEVAVLRRAGTLAQKVAERERALELPTPDASDLLFLAAALGDEGVAPASFAPGEPARAAQPEHAAPSGTLVRVYQRLHALDPADPQLRQTLQSLLERSGRIDEAVQLVMAARVTPAACLEGPLALPPSSGLAAAGEAARIRMRAGQGREAVAEVGRAAARAEGVLGHLGIAELYLELGQATLAARAVQDAARLARSSLERRQVEHARARALALAGDPQALAALHARWRRSGDPCLAGAAAAVAQEPAIGLLAPPMYPPAVPVPPPALAGEPGGAAP